MEKWEEMEAKEYKSIRSGENTAASQELGKTPVQAEGNQVEFHTHCILLCNLWPTLQQKWVQTPMLKKTIKY